MGPVVNRNRIAAMFAAAVLYFAALYSYVPGLPTYVEMRTSSMAAVGLVLSMYGLWMAVLRVPVGIAADVTGRRKPYVLGGVLLAGIGALVMAFGKTLGVLAFGRALSGAAAAAWVPMMVVFAGFFPPEKTIMATSLLSLASSVGQMIATGLTGFLESLGGYGPTFFAAAVFSAASVVIFVILRIPRVPPEHRGNVTLRSVLAIFRRRDVLVPSFASALCQFGIWALTFGFMPLLARRMGAGPVATGLLVTLNIGANTAANLFATLVAGRGGRRALLYGSFALFAAGALVAALGQSVGLLFVSTVIIGLANGLFFPILLGLSIIRVDTAHRSTAMGIHQAVYAVGMFTGPWIGGIVADLVGIRAMFAIVAAFGLVAPSVVMAFNRPRGASASGSSAAPSS
jgi:MFS family permease